MHDGLPGSATNQGDTGRLGGRCRQASRYPRAGSGSCAGAVAGVLPGERLVPKHDLGARGDGAKQGCLVAASESARVNLGCFRLLLAATSPAFAARVDRSWAWTPGTVSVRDHLLGIRGAVSSMPRCGPLLVDQSDSIAVGSLRV